MKFFDFRAFQKIMKMLSHDKIPFHMLFGAFHDTPCNVTKAYNVIFSKINSDWRILRVVPDNVCGFDDFCRIILLWSYRGEDKVYSYNLDL